ncbi:MAG TPA: Uma2 family endonuclease, partial [Candidatus Cybelea sp.]
TRAHNAMVTRLIAAIEPAARPCHTYGSDMLVEMAASTRYPDVVVTCDERDSSDMRALVIRYPKLIVEVLSDSTAQDDLGSKMREYQTIETLVEYVTIDSRKRWAQMSRKSGQEWILNVPATGGTLELRSIGLALDLDEIFAQGGID